MSKNPKQNQKLNLELIALEKERREELNTKTGKGAAQKKIDEVRKKRKN